MGEKILFVQGFCRAAADAMVDDAETENEDERRCAKKVKRSKQEGVPFSASTERMNQYPRRCLETQSKK